MGDAAAVCFATFTIHPLHFIFLGIELDVLSVLAQQILTIQRAKMARVERFVFEGTEINIVPTVFIW